MNRIIYFIAFVIIASAYSCSNELNLIAPNKDIPIVYAFVSPSDTAQYIRLERAFIDAEVSANEIAQRVDSLYYPNATVQLQRESTDKIYTLKMVDGDSEGYPRDAGAFATTPNYLYKIRLEDIPINEGEQYNLLIDRGIDGLDVVTSSTVAVSSPLITRPSSSATLDFDYTSNFTVKWQKGDNNKIFDVNFIINYTERSISDPSKPREFKSVIWQVASNLEDEECVRLGIDFFSFLEGSIPIDTEISRTFENITIVLYVGGQELLDLIRIGQANIGITSSNEIPKYTNISGGLGIFTSRTEVVKENIGITKRSLDSLRFGSITSNLNFK